MASKAKLGDQVTVQYISAIRDGGTTQQRGDEQLLSFIVGSNQVIPGVSFGVVGMVEGEKKQMSLKPEEAYGQVRGELIKEIPRQRFPSSINLEVGKLLAHVRRNSGHRRRVQIVQINPATVVVNANHPLAGKTLEVEMEMISIQ